MAYRNETSQAGVLRERWDDGARTYTAWDAAGKQTSTRAYTAQENADADARLAAASRISSLEDRVKALEDFVFGKNPPPADADAPDWDGKPVEPGGKRKWGGHIWQNKTGAWLTSDPGAYPLGWNQLDLPAAPAWSGASVAYKAGDLVTYQGKTYRCLTAHTSQAAWTPTAAPSLWTTA